MMPATKQHPISAPTTRLIHCLVGEQEYCLEMASVSAITRAHNITPNMESDEPIGWLNAKHTQMPVYDFAHQLGTKPLSVKADIHEGFVLILKSIQPFALKVDRVIESLEIKTDSIVQLPRITDPQNEQFFKGLVKCGEQWALYADPVKFHPEIVQTREPENVSSSESYQHNPLIPPPPTARLRAGVKPQVLLFSAATTAQQKQANLPIVFGLSLTQIQQILDVGKIIPIPCAPPYIVGITNWRNVPLPVINLQSRLGITTSAAAISSQQKNRLLIARTPSQAELIGIVIDPQVKAFPLPLPHQPNKHEFSVDQELIFGVFDLEGMPLVIPNLDGMLTHHFVPQPTPLCVTN